MPLQDGDRVWILSDDFARRMAERLTPEDDQTTFRSAAAVATDVDEAVPPWLTGRWIAVHGAVVRPGLLPVGGAVAVRDLIDAAGGSTPNAREDLIQIASGDAIETMDLGHGGAGRLLYPGDALRVGARTRTLQVRAIMIEGEVARPGTYDSAPGETIADLLRRAGGLTTLADPSGTVLIRQGKPYRDRFSGTPDTRQAGPDTNEAQLPSRIAKPPRIAGRIVIGTDLELLVEAGDRLLIPRRGGVVVVEGEVHNPGAMPYEPGKPIARYIAEAGGPTRSADVEAIHVVMPDGRAYAISEGLVPPSGAAIVVPKDPRVPDDLPIVRLLMTVLARVMRAGTASAGEP